MASSTRPAILLVEDSVSLAQAYLAYLRREPYDVTHVTTGTEALAFISATPPQAIVLDVQLPDMSGISVLEHVKNHALPCAVVVVTGHGSVEIAVAAMRMGAFDFIEKPFSAERLLITLRNALERHRLESIVQNLHDGRGEFCGFVGNSAAMHSIYRIIESVASSRASVFITGESGTGKELCAEALHTFSTRRNRPFVAINCAAIPKELMESEVFGHVKGAFTGAVTAREGAALRADGGTLFLDEICEMDIELQSKLLRFIQTGTFQKVGGSEPEKVDVRFVCATNKDPLIEVSEGRFREDLYYRLHVVPIHMPPLRERDDDVIAIAYRILQQSSREEGKRFVQFAANVERIFRVYEWPGNVRQLQNVIRHMVVLNEGEVVTREMLPAPLNIVLSELTQAPPVQSVVRPPETQAIVTHEKTPWPPRPLWLIEKEAIESAIELCDGNIPRAAALLEVSPSTIYRKLQAWSAKLAHPAG
jgi:two-component system, repressor protein LuxO